MPRRAKFPATRILDAAASLVAANGPGAATIAAIGAALGAPSGSIYHRFASRDVLLGRLWLAKAAYFQDRFVTALGHADPLVAGLAGALSLPRAARDDLRGARITLLHRREDFLSGEWPADMVAEAARLKRQVDGALTALAQRIFGETSARRLRVASFAMLEVPLAAVRRHVEANEPPPAIVDELIAVAYAAAITSVAKPPSGGARPRA